MHYKHSLFVRITYRLPLSFCFLEQSQYSTVFQLHLPTIFNKDSSKI